jgi:hypothetical protein
MTIAGHDNSVWTSVASPLSKDIIGSTSVRPDPVYCETIDLPRLVAVLLPKVFAMSFPEL